MSTVLPKAEAIVILSYPRPLVSVRVLQTYDDEAVDHAVTVFDKPGVDLATVFKPEVVEMTATEANTLEMTVERKENIALVAKNIEIVELTVTENIRDVHVVTVAPTDMSRRLNFSLALNSQHVPMI